MQKTIIITTLVVVAGIIFFATRDKAPKTVRYETAETLTQNVSTDNGTQVIEIAAKGGYSPSRTTAKAGVATIIRVKTNSTFDCSSSLRIPTLGFSQTLPATGTTDIPLPAQTAGTTLKALCSMGMYNFSISFAS